MFYRHNHIELWNCTDVAMFVVVVVIVKPVQKKFASKFLLT